MPTTTPHHTHRRPADRPAASTLLLAIASILAPALATGCATPARHTSPAARVAPERLPTVRHSLAWNQTLADADDTLQRRADPAWAALLQDAQRADIILIGEVHGHQPGLDAAAALFHDLIALRNTNTPALALEFLERDDQLALDDYLTGIIDEQTFRQRTRRTDDNYRGHRDMVEAARAAALPVRAANAPRRYVRLARLNGPNAFDAFTPEQQRTAVMPTRLADAGYAQRFGQIMADMGRGHDPAQQQDHNANQPPHTQPDPLQDPVIAGFFRSQNVWDATMADTMIDLRRAGHQPAVLVVGQFHTDHDGGLTRRIRAALPMARVLTISMVAEHPPADAPHRPEDANRAHALIYTGPLAPPDRPQQPAPTTTTPANQPATSPG